MNRTGPAPLMIFVLWLVPCLAQGQSIMEFQLGTQIEITDGATICADSIILLGTYSGNGTRCGGALFVDKADRASSVEYRLDQNGPNPFNPFTRIAFAVKRETWVSLKIYNLMGKEVSVLVDKRLAPGEYQASFNAQPLASGVYYYQLQTLGFIQSRKFTLVR